VLCASWIARANVYVVLHRCPPGDRWIPNRSIRQPRAADAPGNFFHRSEQGVALGPRRNVGRGGSVASLHWTVFTPIVKWSWFSHVS